MRFYIHQELAVQHFDEAKYHTIRKKYATGIKVCLGLFFLGFTLFIALGLFIALKIKDNEYRKHLKKQVLEHLVTPSSNDLNQSTASSNNEKDHTTTLTSNMRYSKIREYLFLGNEKAASFARNQKNNIISLVDVAENFDALMVKFQTIYPIIKESIDTHKAVFIHCKHGAMRSATIVALYLIRSEQMSRKEAYSEVQKLSGATMFYKFQPSADQAYEEILSVSQNSRSI